ncbi:N-succinyldiaminopimelate aminotransferase [Ferrithrix thermotolerans DSM 19514]|uniref:N-succinyldiaminopimelate aminotransferase n=1 Tax=Ferrithrix thermotolerans DSM 19514 TaxID=1121881 RepID=A0A1M4U645_9ACTN|nr:pyridoxal phosphate-dependent aminotransferase [Ferrithrix thermotolerans]SHE52209.1 N-succinyldiaminopimelate aminotransferase [Ferrithrix thermotolerans DSM 19514]
MSFGNPFLVSRMQGFDTTIFATMSELAAKRGAINLGQGFPDFDGPEPIRDVAVAAIREGRNQYPPARGILRLRKAISYHQELFYGLKYDPESEVLVTAGATEAIAASLLALIEPGDEVLVFEPFYDSYQAAITMAQGVVVPVPLDQPSWSFDADHLKSLVTDRTKAVLINTPHNPTGKVFTEHELGILADLCVRNNLIAITDEVYEHLVFEGAHIPLATFPGMRDRTITISSAAKTFSLTGWKIGWICATQQLLDAVLTTKQFLTYVNGGPFQEGIAFGLENGTTFTSQISQTLKPQRDVLIETLRKTGLAVCDTAGTYFVVTDISALESYDATLFCMELPNKAGVVAIPMEVFYKDRGRGRTLVRWAFCKSPATMATAVERLLALEI